MLDSSEKNNKSAFIKKIHLRKTKRFSTPCLIATLLWELPDDDIIHQPVLANKRPHCGRTALHQSINPLYYRRTWHRTSSLSWWQLDKRWLNWIQAPRFHSPGTFAQATSLFDRRKKRCIQRAFQAWKEARANFAQLWVFPGFAAQFVGLAGNRRSNSVCSVSCWLKGIVLLKKKRDSSWKNNNTGDELSHCWIMLICEFFEYLWKFIFLDNSLVI